MYLMDSHFRNCQHKEAVIAFAKQQVLQKIAPVVGNPIKSPEVVVHQHHVANSPQYTPHKCSGCGMLQNPPNPYSGNCVKCGCSCKDTRLKCQCCCVHECRERKKHTETQIGDAKKDCISAVIHSCPKSDSLEKIIPLCISNKERDSLISKFAEQLSSLYPEVGHYLMEELFHIQHPSNNMDIDTGMAIAGNTKQLLEDLPTISALRQPLLQHLCEGIQGKSASIALGQSQSLISKSRNKEDDILMMKSLPYQTRESVSVHERDSVMRWIMNNSRASAFRTIKQGEKLIPIMWMDCSRSKFHKDYRKEIKDGVSAKVFNSILKSMKHVKKSKESFCCCPKCYLGTKLIHDRLNRNGLYRIIGDNWRDVLAENPSEEELCCSFQDIHDNMEMVEQWKSYNEHCYAKDHQKEYHQRVNDALAQGVKIITIHLDFSFVIKGDTFKWTQCGWFSKSCLQLLSVVVCYPMLVNKEVIVMQQHFDFLSDDLKATSVYAMTAMDIVISKIKSTINLSQFKGIHLATDTTAKQFRQSAFIGYISSLCAKLGMPITYSFCCEYHGKGPCDTRMACIKNTVKVIKQKGVTFNNAADYTRVFDELNRERPMNYFQVLNAAAVDPPPLIAIKGISKFHHFKFLPNDTKGILIAMCGVSECLNPKCSCHSQDKFSISDPSKDNSMSDDGGSDDVYSGEAIMPSTTSTAHIIHSTPNSSPGSLDDVDVIIDD